MGALFLPSLILGSVAGLAALFLWSIASVAEPDRMRWLRHRDVLLILALAGALLLPALDLVTAFFAFDLDPDDHPLTCWSDQRSAATAAVVVRAAAALTIVGLAVPGCSRPWTRWRVALAVFAVTAAAVFAAVEVPAELAERARIDVESRRFPLGHP